MKEENHLHGEFILRARDAKTGAVLSEQRIENQLTAVNQQYRAAMLTGQTTGMTMGDLVIKYFAFGTDATPATAADKQLGAEQYRKQVTQLAKSNASTVTSVCALLAGEANFVIREIGVFCGINASGEANSGIMLARVVVNFEKNSNIVLDVYRQDVCALL